MAKVCPRSSDGLHHYIGRSGTCLCIFCEKDIMCMSLTPYWIEVPRR